MVKVDSKDKLEGYLNSITLISNVEWVNSDKYGFSRELQFTIRGNTYKIIWWANYSKLIINNELSLIFDELDCNGFHANGFKVSLVFMYEGQYRLWIPIEEYENLGGTNL